MEWKENRQVGRGKIRKKVKNILFGNSKKKNL